MRISEMQKTSTLLYDLNKSMEKVLKTQNDISTTKRIHRPSDDPAGVAKLLRMKAVLNRYERYESNVTNSEFQLTTTESAFNSLQEIMEKASSILLQASNDTLGADERAILSTQVQALWESAVDAANQKFADYYVFGGTNNTTAPYTLSSEIEDESFTSQVGTAVNLDHVELSSGTASVSRLFEKDVDYSIDYTTGEITLLGTGGMQTGVDYTISYKTSDGIQIDETINAAVFDTAVSLSNTNIRSSSDDVRQYYTAGVDYTLNEEMGQITVLGSGSMVDAQEYLISYETDAYSVAEPNPDGVDGDLYRVIDEGVSLKINISADEAFGGDSGVLKTLEKAIVALSRNDVDSIKEQRTSLESNMDTLTALLGEVGAKQERLLFQEQKLASDKLSLEELISTIEDTDLAEAAINLQKYQSMYESALQAGSSIIQTSLLDFLS